MDDVRYNLYSKERLIFLLFVYLVMVGMAISFLPAPIFGKAFREFLIYITVAHLFITVGIIYFRKTINRCIITSSGLIFNGKYYSFEEYNISFIEYDSMDGLKNFLFKPHHSILVQRKTTGEIIKLEFHCTKKIYNQIASQLLMCQCQR